MATNTTYGELFATMNGRERDYLECAACGEAKASVTTHNPEGAALCIDCGEAAEDAAILASDSLDSLDSSDWIEMPEFVGFRKHPGRQQAQLDFFGEVA